MKLKNLIKNSPNWINVEYRTFGPDKEDLFSGYCVWNGDLQKLVAGDGDDYSLEDEIAEYEWDSPSFLTVWYESEWISG